MSLDLKELGNKLDKALEKETPKSLTAFLEKHGHNFKDNKDLKQCPLKPLNVLLLFILFLLLTSIMFAQIAPNQNPYCKERGHIEGYPKEELESDHYSRVYDYEDSTVIYHYEIKPYYFVCQRCHEKVLVEPTEIFEEVVWRRDRDTTYIEGGTITTGEIERSDIEVKLPIK